MMRKHMTYSTRTLSFVGCKHIVELKHAGEEATEKLSHSLVRYRCNSFSQDAQAKQLARVKHFVPRLIAIVDGLICVVARLYSDCRIGIGSGRKLLLCLLKRSAVVFVTREGRFLSVSVHHELCIKPMLRRPGTLLDCINYAERLFTA